MLMVWSLRFNIWFVLLASVKLFASAVSVSLQVFLWRLSCSRSWQTAVAVTLQTRSRLLLSLSRPNLNKTVSSRARASGGRGGKSRATWRRESRTRNDPIHPNAPELIPTTRVVRRRQAEAELCRLTRKHLSKAWKSSRVSFFRRFLPRTQTGSRESRREEVTGTDWNQTDCTARSRSCCVRPLCPILLTSADTTRPIQPLTTPLKLHPRASSRPHLLARHVPTTNPAVGRSRPSSSTRPATEISTMREEEWIARTLRMTWTLSAIISPAPPSLLAPPPSSLHGFRWGSARIQVQLRHRNFPGRVSSMLIARRRTL